MRLAILLLSLSLIQGCAGFTLYVQQHAAGIAAFSLAAGAVASGESAISGAWTLMDKAREEVKDEPAK